MGSWKNTCSFLQTLQPVATGKKHQPADLGFYVYLHKLNWSSLMLTDSHQYTWLLKIVIFFFLGFATKWEKMKLHEVSITEKQKKYKKNILLPK